MVIQVFLEKENSSDKSFIWRYIYIIKQNDKYINLDISSYGEIFSLMCGGFDDCETSEEESSEEEELPNSDDENFIVDDEEEIISDESYTEEDDLDIDENEYSDEDED